MNGSEQDLDLVALEITHLSKTFGDTRVLRDVSLRVGSGEIVALCGQNGSGKSTFIKVLAGFHEADPGGEVRVHGELASKARLQSGSSLHFIHQDLALVSTLSAVENLDLPKATGWSGLRSTHPEQEARRAEAKLAQLGAQFDVRVPISQLTPAERTMVAIARATSGWDRPDNILILDEPTTSLHRGEVNRLFAAVRALAQAGAAVIFVSHRLDEVESLADRIVVFRDGNKVADVPMADYSRQSLIRHMIGSDVTETLKGRTPSARREVLSVSSLTGTRLEDINFEIAAGEIVGFSGLIGSGVETLGATVFGARSRPSGEVSVRGMRIPPERPSASIGAGFAYAPADRQALGAVMTMNLRENVTLPHLRSVRGRLGQMKARAEARDAKGWTTKLGVRPNDPERYMSQLSGGNQQKIVLAKWLRLVPSALWLDEPTQGVDVGAKAAIYELISEAAADGIAVAIASTDAKELAMICHRVVVLNEGRIVADLTGDELTEERLLQESLGRTNPPVAA